MSADAFLRRFPVLFHVTRDDNLPGIRAQGLRPARDLGACDANRDGWTRTAKAWLRWQRMPDGPMASRLAEGISPAAWRAHINGLVFFATSRAEAERLLAVPKDAGIAQRVLSVETASLWGDLAWCPFNNGFLDRAPPERRRRRSPQDYRPLSAWRPGDPVREVVSRRAVPAALLRSL